jgi:hypothetical protein
MDIHKPKAAHNWREFLIEIGTIVCGILIALGLEQVVESAHWAEKAREAKGAIHDDLVQATVFGEERVHLEDCRDAYLVALAAAVAASPPQWTPRPKFYCGIQHDRVYSGVERPWPTEVWRSIEVEGTVSHLGDHYRRGAPFLFKFIEFINDRALEETQETNNLNALGYSITMTPDAKIRFLNSIDKLRNQNSLLALLCGQMFGQIAHLGEKPGEAELETRRALTPYYRGGLPARGGAQP